MYLNLSDHCRTETMAQSRFEKIGTIYSRVMGLYKSGAIKSEQVPLWVPIYEAFPPKYEPRYDRIADDKPVIKILYPEDKVRAKFYKTFGDWEVVNLLDNKKPTSQLFVDKYMEICQTSDNFSEQELWDRTVSDLENSGIDLMGTKGASEVKIDEVSAPTRKISFKDMFNEETK